MAPFASEQVIHSFHELSLPHSREPRATTAVNHMLLACNMPCMQRHRKAQCNTRVSTLCIRPLQCSRQAVPVHIVYSQLTVLFCRCFPAFDSATLSEVVTVLGLRNYSSSSAASLYSKSFGSSGQRLQRYIADIHKGILIILVSGLLLHSLLLRIRYTNPLTASQDCDVVYTH